MTTITDATTGRQPLRYTLMGQDDVPADRRKTLLAYPFSARRQMAIDAAFDESRKVDSLGESAEAIFNAIAPAVVGWEGFVDPAGNPVPYSPDALMDTLTVADAYELRREFLPGMSLAQMKAKQAGREEAEKKTAPAA